MMPHLGVLASVHPQAAMEVFEKDCLIYLGTCVAAKGQGKIGKACSCSIYARRPKVCRDFEPGSADCLAARSLVFGA